MRIGIDIGGTFTDFVLLRDDGKLILGKTLTTYPDASAGVVDGLRTLLAEHAIEASRLSGLVHGTTLVTNAIIERKGARTGLLTTSGFEDVLEIGRELRYDIYDLQHAIPDPIVPRRLRLGVVERIDKDGRDCTPLDEDSVVRSARKLADDGCDAVAVAFLHAFQNGAHERRAADLIRREVPGLVVSLSSEVLPEIREFERTSTTVLNAYVQPMTERYLANLERWLRELGFDGTFHLMLASGRLTTADQAARYPVHLIESGPAGGAKAAGLYAQLTDSPDLLAFDMGGTTAKACLLVGGTPAITNESEVARVRRFTKGSGLPTRVPMVELIEIGAGGGSIAYLDPLGLLRVGPQSAGSEPGPACYGRGGELPTVTDADLVLGYLDPRYFLGGRMALSRGRAEEAIQRHVAGPLGLDVVAAALGIHRVVNENMANATRIHILEKGKDPRRFPLLAFGGAGPVHAVQVARLLKSPRVIVPQGAGVMSSLGFLVAPIAVDYSRSYPVRLDRIDWSRLNAILDGLEACGRRFLLDAGVGSADIAVSRDADMRYRGQGHEIRVPVPSGGLGPDDLDRLTRAFYETYEKRYGRYATDVPIEAVTWRVLVSGPEPDVRLEAVAPRTGQARALKGNRSVFFQESNGFVETAVYDRYALAAGMTVAGPAIVEERESTLVVPPGWRVVLDSYGNAIVDSPGS